ncbi:hypothetical protein VTL71DRAFT_6752 [Oculimacula yallundae]|uniref:Uncharacterized protein n=1 Tax=Oculimacula yallundae TaxID=86028 RepID=A0ABR4BXU4_9HELO
MQLPRDCIPATSHKEASHNRNSETHLNASRDMAVNARDFLQGEIISSSATEVEDMVAQGIILTSSQGDTHSMAIHSTSEDDAPRAQSTTSSSLDEGPVSQSAPSTNMDHASTPDSTAVKPPSLRDLSTPSPSDVAIVSLSAQLSEDVPPHTLLGATNIMETTTNALGASDSLQPPITNPYAQASPDVLATPPDGENEPKALPGPRILSIEQRRIKKTIGEWEDEQGRTWPITVREMQELSLADDLVNSKTAQMALRGVSSKFGAPHPNPDSLIRLFTVQETHEHTVAMANISTYSNSDFTTYRQVSLVGYHPSHKPPHILYAYHESRDVVLGCYQQVFSSIGAVPETFMDFEIDTLYLRTNTLSVNLIGWFADLIFEEIIGEFGMLDFRYLQGVKSLSILLPIDQRGETYDEPWLLNILRLFRNLEVLTIILREYRRPGDNSDTSMEFMPPADLEEAMRKMKDFLRGDGEGVANIRLLDFSAAEIDMGELESYRDRDKINGCAWKLPAIRYRVAVTNAFAVKFVDMHCRYGKKVASMHHDESGQALPLPLVALED